MVFNYLYDFFLDIDRWTFGNMKNVLLFRNRMWVLKRRDNFKLHRPYWAIEKSMALIFWWFLSVRLCIWFPCSCGVKLKIPKTNHNATSSCGNHVRAGDFRLFIFFIVKSFATFVMSLMRLAGWDLMMRDHLSTIKNTITLWNAFWPFFVQW